MGPWSLNDVVLEVWPSPLYGVYGAGRFVRDPVVKEWFTGFYMSRKKSFSPHAAEKGNKFHVVFMQYN